MILRIDPVVIDLGRASTMTPIVKEVRQTVLKTASGKDYTQTWDYYERGGYTFSFDFLEKTLFEDLEGFVVLDAQGSRNPFELTDDHGNIFTECYFSEKGKITAGESRTQTTTTGQQNVYLNVSFGVIIHA